MKAIAYRSGLWAGLVRFLGDPKIPLGTNGVERALRSVAVGRKNHYGSRSELGTRVAALFYSPIESAKLCGAEPRAYLGKAARQAIRNAGAVTRPRDLESASGTEASAIRMSHRGVEELLTIRLPDARGPAGGREEKSDENNENSGADDRVPGNLWTR